MTDLTDGVPFLPAVFYNNGRDGREIDCLILHEMATDLAGCDATFQGGARIASATYGIQDDTIHQYVREADGSYNAADWDINMRSIALEHSATPTRPPSPATIATSIQVIAAKMVQYPAIGDRVYPHNQFVATYCPGILPWQSMRDEALRLVHGGPTPPPPVLLPLLQETDMLILVKATNAPDIYVTNLVTRRRCTSMTVVGMIQFWMAKHGYPAELQTIQTTSTPLDDWGIEVH